MPTSLTKFRQILPWLVLATGLAVTYVLQERAREVERAEWHNNFRFRADDLIQALEGRLEKQMLLLQSVASMIGSTDHLTRQEFKSYIKTLRLQKIHPGVFSVGFAHVLPQQDLAKHVARWKRIHGPKYAVWPDSGQPMRSAIVLTELAGNFTATAMLGFDMFSDPTRRAAMELARDLRTIAITPKIRLRPHQPDQVDGIQMFFPIYKRDTVSDTIEQRRQNLRGWAYAPIMIDEFIGNVVDTFGTGLQIEIYNAKEPRPASLMAVYPGITPKPVSDTPLPIRVKLADIGGQSWLIRVSPLNAENNRPDHTLTLTTAISGMLISLLLFLYLWTQTRSHENAEKIALGLTHDLRESEHRWKFAIEGQGDGLWDWNVQDGTVYFSSRWKSMLGYGEDEIGGHVNEWDSRLHPDDRQHVYDILVPFIEGKSSAYTSEHRLRCKDGSWKWILDRGMVVSRASDGHALRVIGTHTDITQRKLMEARIEGAKQLYATLSRVNQAIIRHREESSLLAELCDILVQTGGMNMAWVGMLNQHGQLLDIVASSGMDKEYLSTMQISAHPDTYVIATPNGTPLGHQPVWINDILTSNAGPHWQQRAQTYGWRSLAILPLHRMGVLCGVLLVYAFEPGKFDDEARRLLIEVADNISNALDNYVWEADRTVKETALQAAHLRMTELSARLMETQEDERKHLARELHDEMGQRFTALSMAVHQLRHQPPEKQEESAWNAIQSTINALITRVRTMSGSLRPPTLDHLGLEASLHQLLKEHFSHSDIQWQLEFAGLPAKLPSHVEIAVYRIVQEAVTNVLRHANASRVVVEVNGGENADELELIVRDNGTGFDASSLMHSARVSYGLTGMVERARLLGGSLEVISHIGQGTRITALLPLKR